MTSKKEIVYIPIQARFLTEEEDAAFTETLMSL